MTENPAAAEDLTTLTTALEGFSGRLVDGLQARYAGWTNAPAEFESFRASLAAGSTSLGVVCFQIGVVVGVVAGTLMLVGWQADRQGGNAGKWRLLLNRRVGAGPTTDTATLDRVNPCSLILDSDREARSPAEDSTRISQTTDRSRGPDK